MKIEKLIERVKAGDADALRTVYETYSQRMRNVCIRITQEDEDTVSDPSKNRLYVPIIH